MEIKDKLLPNVRRACSLVAKEIDYYRCHPSECCIEPTYRCTLKCETCGIRHLKDLRSSADELTYAELCRIVDEVKEMGVTAITIVGGEPLVRKDTLDLIGYIKEKGMRCLLITNATLLDADTAQQLVALNLDRVVISLDALGEGHDRIRGVAGTFAKVEQGINLLNEEKERQRKSLPFLGIHITVSKLNADELTPLVDFLHGKGINEITFQYLSETPGAAVAETVLAGEKIASPRFIPRNGSLLLDAAGVDKLKAALPLLDSSVYTKLIKSFSAAELISGEFPVRRCYSVRDALIVNPHGDIYLCPHLDRYVIGNVREESLRAIWGNMRHKALLRRLEKELFPVCRHCCSHMHNMTPGQLIRMYFKKSHY